MAKISSAVLTHRYEIIDKQNGIDRIKKMRSIELRSKTGKPISVFQSEDNLAAIELILKENGWSIVSWSENSAGIIPIKAGSSTNSAPPPNTKGCAIGCFSFIAIIFILGSCVALTSKDSGDSRAPSTFRAEMACENSILPKLNAPSTAEFSQRKIRTHEPDLKYTIVGVVESENRLGGIVGSKYRCDVEKAADNKDWTSISSVFN